MNTQTLGLKYDQQTLRVLDQTALPHEEIWLSLETTNDIVEAIKTLKVRGAPMIALACCLFVAISLKRNPNMKLDEFLALTKILGETRPTAVNLMNALNQIEKKAKEDFVVDDIIKLCHLFLEEDKNLCEKMAQAGANLIKDGDSLLTHCNTGALATGGLGTALGVIHKAHKQGKNIHVFVDETRPLLQGGRLTTWELGKLNIKHTLICDNMAASLMAQGKVNHILVGADRITKNGDVANKIGTYSLAVLAKYHSIPFTVVAPSTTLDTKMLSGSDIPIEQRDPKEVKGAWVGGQSLSWAPEGSPAYNPAFDITPAKLITHWVIDGQLISEPSALT